MSYMTIPAGLSGIGCEGCPGKLTGCQGCNGLFSKLRKSSVGKAVKKILKPIQKAGTKVGSPVRVALRKFDPVTMIKVAGEKKKRSSGGHGGSGGGETQIVYVTAPARPLYATPPNYSVSPSLQPSPYPQTPAYYPQTLYYQPDYVPPSGYEYIQEPGYDQGPGGQPVPYEDTEFGYSGGEWEDSGEPEFPGAEDMAESELAQDDGGEYLDDGLGEALFIGPVQPQSAPPGYSGGSLPSDFGGTGNSGVSVGGSGSSGPSSGDISNILSSIVTGAASIGQALLQGKAQVAVAKANAAAGRQNVFVPAQNQNFRPAGLPQGGAVPAWVWLAGAAAAGIGILSIMKRK